MLAGMVSCGASSDKKSDETVTDSQPAVETTTSDSSDNVALINAVYEKFVFATDSDGDMNPETYFTANALKKLQDDYEFDCDEGPCYAFNALRTEMQDSKPGSDEASVVCEIEPDGDGWYAVSYSDMGWPGKTRVRIIDGKIDDYERTAL